MATLNQAEAKAAKAMRLLVVESACRIGIVNRAAVIPVTEMVSLMA